jgi:predicted glutamine amidotransferase
MGRLFAYMGNDPDRVRCALHPAKKLLRVTAEPGQSFDSWGIGFYQGEVLLQRRPKAPVDPVDFYDLGKELRTDCLVGHVRSGTVGQPKNENTHPFRFRSWLFAHHGTLPVYDRIETPLAEQIPDFLRRNIRGQTDSEALFHLILAELHEDNLLDDPNLSTQGLRNAMQRAFMRVRDLAGTEAMDKAEIALAMTNGRILVATRHGNPVHVMKLQSMTDCAVCRESEPQFGRQPKQHHHEHLRAVILVADSPGGNAPWQEVPDKTFVSVSHSLELSQAPIQL